MFGITRAPDFDRAGLTWVNVDNPLTLADFSGKLLILDFFTYCCINCIHVQPTLRRIEEAFANEIVVVGVHSPKFMAERFDGSLRQAIARHDIRHPVVHDPHLTLWDEYAVRAWPTLVFVSPQGRVIGRLAGEPNTDMLLQGIGNMVAEFWRRGEISPAPFPVSPPARPTGRLSFPGKIKLAPLARGRAWAVADAGHHQIVLFDDSGRELRRYGAGIEGFEDGPAESARFRSPQGLACVIDAIFVADTGNHAIRRIDRTTGEVRTVAGMGVRGPALEGRAQGLRTALASPWDLELLGNDLYFANAGSHQIGRLDLGSGGVESAAGCGIEDIADGPALEAGLAQPSGLAVDARARSVYFADSETSSVRALRLDGAARVETLVGTGLFDAGHVNGAFSQALFQHPLGLTVFGRRLLVADSYNGAIRQLDLRSRTVTDLDIPHCRDPLCRPLGEPAGIATAGRNRLLVSDTNNHRILEYRLDQGTMRSWATP